MAATATERVDEQTMTKPDPNHDCSRRSRFAKSSLATVLISSLPILGLFDARTAHADVAACAQAHAAGQREAKNGRLKEAAQLFAACLATDGCPDAIRAECLDFARDTEKSLPTLIFAVSDAAGRDLVDVQVYATGDASAPDELLAEKLDGRAIAIDPGEHHFKLVLASGETLLNEVVVREGEKNRIVSVHAPAPAPPAPAAAPASAEPRAALPPAFWVSSGVAAAALTSFSVFSLLGHGRQSNLSACSPGCSPSHRDDFDAMHRDYLIGDVSLGIALASAGAATWFYFSSRHSDRNLDRPHEARLVERVAVLPASPAPGLSIVVSSGL